MNSCVFALDTMRPFADGVLGGVYTNDHIPCAVPVANLTVKLAPI